MERNRGLGRTTRLCNDYIEELFSSKGNWITILDHWEDGNNKHANSDLHRKILKRLSFENSGSKVEFTKKTIRIL